MQVIVDFLPSKFSLTFYLSLELGNILVRVNVPKAFASSLVSKIDEAVNSLPLREAVRYTGKNMKWTAKEFLV